MISHPVRNQISGRLDLNEGAAGQFRVLNSAYFLDAYHELQRSTYRASLSERQPVFMPSQAQQYLLPQANQGLYDSIW